MNIIDNRIEELTAELRYAKEDRNEELFDRINRELKQFETIKNEPALEIGYLSGMLNYIDDEAERAELEHEIQAIENTLESESYI